MTRRYSARLITDAPLPIRTVDKSVLAGLKSRTPTYVPVRQFKSGHGVLISEKFARCQGVGFLDRTAGIGALAHNFTQHDPYDFLTGQLVNTETGIWDIRQIFLEPSGVSAMHIYRDGHRIWSNRYITSALKTVGIEDVLHIPIKPKIPGRVEWFSIAIDVPAGLLYVFPTDHEHGIYLEFGQR